MGRRRSRPRPGRAGGVAVGPRHRSCSTSWRDLGRDRAEAGRRVPRPGGALGRAARRRTSRRSSSSTPWCSPGRARRGRLTAGDGQPTRPDRAARGHRHGPGPGRRLPLLRPPRGDGPRARGLGREHDRTARSAASPRARATGSRSLLERLREGPPARHRRARRARPGCRRPARSVRSAVRSRRRTAATDRADPSAGANRDRWAIPSGTHRRVIVGDDGAEVCLPRSCPPSTAPSSTASPSSRRPASATWRTASAPRRPTSTRGPGTSARGGSSRRSSAAARPRATPARARRPDAASGVGRPAPPDDPRRPPRRGRLAPCPPRPSVDAARSRPRRLRRARPSSARRSRTSGRTSTTSTDAWRTRFDEVAARHGDDDASDEASAGHRPRDRRDRTDRGPAPRDRLAVDLPAGRPASPSGSDREVPGRRARRPGRRLRRHPGGPAGRSATATLLADATPAQRVLARAVMNGETTDPAGWRTMFPTLFGPSATGDAAERRPLGGDPRRVAGRRRPRRAGPQPGPRRDRRGAHGAAARAAGRAPTRSAASGGSCSTASRPRSTRTT